MAKRIAIVGAGISGLLACKHTMKSGFDPVVFESSSEIGGIWSNTIESTKLQTPKQFYQFSDFPWPDSVTETFPTHTQVLSYLRSYAEHFNILPRIKFRSQVTSIDYVEASKKWVVAVMNSGDSSFEVYEFDFVIVCIGRYSGLPNIPDFPLNKGPDVFKGHVSHSMDFASMDRSLSSEAITGKRVVVVGFQKSAVDLAVEIASKNGKKNPCTVLFRKVHWTVPEKMMERNVRSMSRSTELLVHKPNEGFLRWVLVLLLTPLLFELYLKRIYPLRKHNMVPSHDYFSQIFSCRVTVLPEKFYQKVEEGSIVLKKMNSFHFSENGLIIDGNTHLKAEAVIFATGYKSEEKLKRLFSCVYFKECVGSSSPLYRECVHPRIPQAAILGYTDSSSVLFTTEMRSKWVAAVAAGRVALPAAKKMEEEGREWESCMRRYAKDGYRKSCVSVMMQIHCHDQICKDLGFCCRRKRWFWSEMFCPYAPQDYKNL